MAIDFRFVNARVTSGGVAASGTNSLSSAWQQTLTLEAFDDGYSEPGQTWDERNSSIDEMDVVEWLNTKQDRSVNNVLAVRTKYNSDLSLNDQEMVLPWHIMSNCTIVRNPENGKIFDAALTYSVPSSFTITVDDIKWIPLPNQVDDYPWLQETVFGSERQMIWNKTKTGPPERLCLPTGNQFSEPFYKRVPARVHRQRQYEPISASNIETTIEERLFTLCDRNFKGDPPEPQRWMCTHIEYQPMKIPIVDPDPLSSGIQYDDGYLMTYTLERSNKAEGWKDERALIDTHYLTTANDVTTKEQFKFREGSQMITTGLIKADGTAKGDQNEPVDLLGYEVQPVGLWDWLKQ